MIDFIEEVIRRCWGAFADVPINGIVGIGDCLVAKTDLHWTWRN